MNKSFEIEYWRRENWEDHGWNFHFAYGLADGVSFDGRPLLRRFRHMCHVPQRLDVTGGPS